MFPPRRRLKQVAAPTRLVAKLQLLLKAHMGPERLLRQVAVAQESRKLPRHLAMKRRKVMRMITVMSTVKPKKLLLLRPVLHQCRKRSRTSDPFHKDQEQARITPGLFRSVGGCALDLGGPRLADLRSLLQNMFSIRKTVHKIFYARGSEESPQTLSYLKKIIVHGTGPLRVTLRQPQGTSGIDLIAIDRIHDVLQLGALGKGFCDLEATAMPFHGKDDARMYQLLEDLCRESLRRIRACRDLRNSDPFVPVTARCYAKRGTYRIFTSLAEHSFLLTQIRWLLSYRN